MKGFGSKKENIKKNNLIKYENLFQKALKFHSKGELKEAKSLYEAIINKGILEAKVLTNLGTIYQQLKQPRKAIELYKRSISEFPKSYEAYSNLGKIYINLGQHALAENYLIKVVTIKPDYLMAYQNLFNLYLNINQVEKAENALYKCLQIDPNNILTLSNLGRFLLEKGKFDKAKQFIIKAISLKPDFWIGYNNLAILEASIGNLTEAEKNFQRVIELNPKFFEAYVNLGEVKIDLNKIDEAESLFLKSLEIKKDYSPAYCSLLRLYEKTNNIKKLKQKLDSLRGSDFIQNELLLYNSRVLFREKRYKKAKELIEKISLGWLKETDINTRINFWSFKAFIEEKSNNFDEAYNSFLRSQINPKYEKCDPKIFRNYIINYEKNLQNDDYFIKRNEFFKEKSKVVFLIGFPRSGTTLLDTILRSHPYVDVIEEKPILNLLENIIKSQFNCKLAEIYKLNEDEVRILQTNYLHQLTKLSDKKNAQIFIDKFPFQTVCLPLINFIFPDARIIFAHRHPYDTVLSCFQQAFEPNNAMANLKSLKESSKIYDLTMNMWVKYKENLNLDFTISKYESLVDDFENHTKKILEFLNLEWDSSIKNFNKTALSRTKINTPSSSQVVQPLYKTSIGKWKNYKKNFEECHIYLEKWVKYFEYSI